MGYVLGIEDNQLKDFSLTIDGVKLSNAQIISLKVKWSIENFKIVGTLLFRDISSLVENLPIRGDNKFVMALTDSEGNVSKQEFRVIKVSYTKSNENQLLTSLELLDPITIATTQMYNEMSWKKEDMVGIIDHDETMKPLLVGKKKNFGKPAEKHENFVMPLHVPFNVVSHWLAKNNNMMWFQTREEFVIQPLKKLFSKSNSKDKFMLKTPNTSYKRRVFEFSSNFGNLIEANTFQATGKVASFDPSNKHAKWTDNDFKKALGELGSKGSKDLKLPGTGNKHFYKTDYHIKDNVKMMWGKNAFKSVTLEMIVPGQFSTNIGEIVELDFVNSVKITEPEANINGEWLIIECVDIITPTDFIQRLTLARAKFSK